MKHVRDYDGGWAVCYGILRGCLDVMRQADQFWYIDHGYYGRGTYYRVVHNQFQHDGLGDYPSDRWDSLNIEIKPWRSGGEYYLVCPPSPYVEESFQTQGWMEQVTDRFDPVHVRSKHAKTTLQWDLRKAKALVTFNSNAAVEAVIDGVPAFADRGPCAGMKDRETMLRNLAYGQWTIREIEEGLPWRDLESGSEIAVRR